MYKTQDTRELLSQSKFFDGYSRWDDNKGRYETWEEAVGRVMNMHRSVYKDVMTPELSRYIDEAESLYKLRYVLGAQRALQFGGEQILSNNMRMYNCFHRDTKFVTSEGLKSFNDYKNGDEVLVKTPQGNWKKAIVKSYGKQQLNSITFKKSGAYYTVQATANHRWLLKDGTETTNLSVGDALCVPVNTFNDFVFDTAESDEKLYWIYGFVYGDGTVGNNGYSKVRLCDKDRQYEYRFTEMGFKTSSSLSLKGDIIAFTGSYKKTLPDPKIDEPRLIRAFVRGLLDADGEKAVSRFDHDKFIGIQQSNVAAIEFIRTVFPVAGIYPLSEGDLTGQVTKFGVRPETSRFRFASLRDSKYASPWRVVEITPSTVETVWCLEVEDDAAFILEKGIPTGNCTATYADRASYFGEYFWILLCGAGAGVSVQFHHVNNLPAIQNRTKQAKIYEIDDSIEGWAAAADVLMSSYFVGGGKHPEYEGRRVYFDTTKIRPKGAHISGGFKAPGPEPLRRSLDKIEYLLQGLVLSGVEKLRPIHVYDISMHLADAVLAGGVRRSATIFLFSPDDEEMATAKTGDWYVTNPQRARSNNSAVVVRDNISREQFSNIMKSVREYGEPGFYFTESTEHVTNPCVTADTMVLTDAGRKPVSELINTPFNAIVDGKPYAANGFWKTGTKQVYKLTTEHGYSVRATDNHKILTTTGWVELGDLNIGDSVILNENNLPSEVDIREYQKGWAVGSFHGDGTITGNSVRLNYWNNEIDSTAKYAHSILTEHFRTTKDFSAVASNLYDGKNSCISFESTALYSYAESVGAILNKKKYNGDRLEKQSNSFKLGYIAGLIDSDGSWQGSIQGGLSVRITQRSIERLEQVQRMLIDLGIRSTIYSNRNKSRIGQHCGLPGMKNPVFGEMNDLAITGKSLTNLANMIVFQNPKYAEFYQEINLYTKGPYKSKFNDKIKSITPDGVEDVYDVTVEEVHRFDANGIIVHNCVEIGLYPTLEGETGWQGCNLTEINGSKATTKEEFFKACTAAAIIGTLQAGYTNFKFVSDVTKKIFDRESLLGVSITGWMNNPQVLLDEEILVEGAELVKQINQTVAKLIGINPAARTTCVKPAGSSCTTFDTKIRTEKGPMSLKEIFSFCSRQSIDVDVDNIGDDTSFQVVEELKVYDEHNELRDITGLYFNGMARIYEVEFEDGSVYKFTDHHKLKTTTGWKQVCDLTEDDEIIDFGLV